MLPLFSVNNITPFNQGIVVLPQNQFIAAPTLYAPGSLAVTSLFSSTPFQDLGSLPGPTAKGN
jgi:hypothetical protein